jgi:hypothetical protein
VRSFPIHRTALIENLFSRLSSLADLQSYTRYIFTLRTSDALPTTYHTLLLFRLSQDPSDIGSSVQKSQMYVMESACPHLGADLSHAEIEDWYYDPDDVGEVGEEARMEKVAVCPWHRKASGFLGYDESG